MHSTAEDDMVRTLPRINSLNSDADSSLDGSQLADGISDRHDAMQQNNVHTTQNSRPVDGILHQANGHLESDGLQAPPEVMQDAPDPPARVPSLASRILSPFAAFALQTRSASHSSIPSDHDGVT